MAKIVFIEDEPALQKSLGEFLRSQGHEVYSALNGEEGLTMVRTYHPDLALIDIVLPRMDGLEVLRTMRSDPVLRNIAAVMLTNSESSDAVEEAVALGAKAYLIKTSYTLAEVSEKLKSILGS
ncbi:MAG: hypothetical protein A3A44_00150 [Candidatus Sungbacteria bacterium RIFCSPLOWO2_01_FULL_60_25]|uniref:Response regulatory domain-containing protein n=1 Tax=Candidatus Sungbacteria bacterium RIFCSPLOWO2_01_FULL_60_25 TaxID=1802281 RepID=A0A1G2LA07_9BACT|nr:MAG: hypothetical protein A3A44_00150 [Candidatus Sungbacteria bacterium RIFCSPLOWO2_01_FULL_60_25]